MRHTVLDQSDANVVDDRISEELDPGQAPPDIDEAEFGGREARLDLERKLLRKLDLRMSILVLIYILNYIDRNNASAARLEGFEADLHLTGQQFNTLLGVLYFGYILMQIPSNMFLNHIGKPSIYLPACTMIWGFMSILTGTARDFTGALISRFFLGFVEASFFPGALFLLSKWYKRSELGLRTAVLSSGLLISNAFGSLMASGILSGMQGKLGFAAWRWLFFIEGALTILVAVVAVFVLPDFPHKSHWLLSSEELRLVEVRMQEDAGLGGSDEIDCKDSHVPASGLLEALSDWRVYWLALANASLIISLSFNAFFPTLTETLGYSPTVTLLLCAPPWIFATVVALAVSRHSDMTGERFFHIVIPLFIGIIGFVIAISTTRLTARYVSFFLMVQSYSGCICFWTWAANIFARTPSKLAVALAFINSFAQLGNIVGSYAWQKSWGPTYTYSYAICILTNGLCIAMCFILRWALSKENEPRESSGGRGYGYILLK